MEAIIKNVKTKINLSEKMREKLTMGAVFIGLSLSIAWILSTVFDGMVAFHVFMEKQAAYIKKHDEFAKEIVESSPLRRCTNNISN